MYASITSLPVALFLALFVRSANSFISLLAESRESALPPSLQTRICSLIIKLKECSRQIVKSNLPYFLYDLSSLGNAIYIAK
jgi:hypothetical protein